MVFRIVSRLSIGLVLLFGAPSCSDTEPSTIAVGAGASGGSGGQRPSAGGGGQGASSSTSAQGGGVSFFDVPGVVLDRDGVPVDEAMVMQAGRSQDLIMTDEDGTFVITLKDTGVGVPGIVAAKMGYRAIGKHMLGPPDSPIELRLHKVKGPDNIDYVYEDPGDGQNTDLEDCTHCHQYFVQQFLSSKHAESTKNPLLQDLYAGVNRKLTSKDACEQAGGSWKQGLEPGSASQPKDKCYLGQGVLTELNPQCGGANQTACDDPAAAAQSKPSHFGACADCHAPGINGVAGGRNLHEAVGTAFEKGVHCDTCHKVADVDMTKPPGVGQRLVMGRPSEPGENTFKWEPVYYGPIIDVPNPMMRASYQPKFNSAMFCAGCHEQDQPALLPGQSLDAARWPDGLPVHSTYSEWKAGPYAQTGVPCQHCHMPANYDTLNSVALMTEKKDESITFGWERPGVDNRMHLFRGPLHGEPRLIDGALHVSVKVTASSGQVAASVSVANVGAGHAVPTGEPMRSLVLLVEAEAGSCGALAPMGGMSINDLGGAHASGVVGQQVSFLATTVSWAEAASVAQAGQRLRVVRPSGSFDDYAGIGVFAGSTLSPEQKGMPIHNPVGHAEVVSVNGSELSLSAPLAVAPGDIVYLGDPWPSAPVDGEPSRHLAGAAGYTFARVLVDANGERQVPHYRAVDMVSDNRIAPGGFARTEHVFARGSQCTSGTIRATVLYRPHPLRLSQRQGWDAKDYVIAASETAW